MNDTKKFLGLWKRTYDNWFEIEPEEPDVTDETLIHIKYLLKISSRVHFLNGMYKKAIELDQYDYIWIVNFKFGDLKMQWQTDKNLLRSEELPVQVDGVNQSHTTNSTVKMGPLINLLTQLKNLEKV